MGPEEKVTGNISKNDLKVSAESKDSVGDTTLNESLLSTSSNHSVYTNANSGDSHETLTDYYPKSKDREIKDKQVLSLEYLNSSSESEYLNALTDLDSKLQQSQEIEEELVPQEPVITKRVRKQPERFGYTNLCTTSPEFSGDPVSIREALASQDRDKWIEAMKEELQAFEENDAWVQVDELPSDKTLVQCKWVYKRKVNSDNSVRYRARLVAKGFTQSPGIDYEETFSPVVRHSTLKLLYALSVQLKSNGEFSTDHILIVHK